ncbi:MAG: hypothetical protein AB2L14_32110 [Candidatus Xenobiia bacterium LiM19]
MPLSPDLVQDYIYTLLKGSILKSPVSLELLLNLTLTLVFVFML